MKLRNAVFKPNIVDYVRVRLPSTPLKNALFTGILGIKNIKVLNKVLKIKYGGNRLRKIMAVKWLINGGFTVFFYAKI